MGRRTWTLWVTPGELLCLIRVSFSGYQFYRKLEAFCLEDGTKDLSFEP